MIIKCKSCDAVFVDALGVCPYCGAVPDAQEPAKDISNEKADPTSLTGIRERAGNAAAANVGQAYASPQQPVQHIVLERHVQTAAADEGTIIATLPEKYKPISMWGYFGYQILFAIPIVGIILLIVFGFGGGSNINLRNFARSYFCFWILAVILIALFIPNLFTILRYML